MLRVILVLFWLVLFLILSLPVQLVLFLIQTCSLGRARNWVRRVSLAIVSRAFRILMVLAGVRLTVKGVERIPVGEPVLYVGNHHSYFDTVISYSQRTSPTGYIAKKAMRKVPILSIWMWFLDCYFLDRNDIKDGMRMIQTCTDKINEGVSFTIFPEGTRNKTTEELLPFHKGSFKLAQRTGCAIVPMVFNNTAAIYEAHPGRIRAAHVVMEYGAPIYYKDLTKEEARHIDDVVRDRILEIYRRNGALV